MKLKPEIFEASIARGADFYGTEDVKGVMDVMVLDKLKKKQKPQWLGDAEQTAQLQLYS